MSNTMRSVFYLEPEHLELRQVPIPVPQAGELLVKVRAALTCGTDVKTYRRGHPKFPPPFAFGHEFGGDVVEVGQGVQEFKPGDPVTANVFAECGECFYCRKGQGNLCENLIYNFGAFSEFMIIPKPIVRLNTFKIPSSISYAQAAVLEPLVTVVHGQARIAIQPGESVALIGAGGPISLLHLQLARRAGAAQLIAIGHSPTRLEIASYLGATQTINANEQDSVQAVRDLTGGYGADVVIECAGTKLAWATAFDSVRKGGRVLWFGGLSGGAQIELDAARIHYGEISMFGIHGGTHADARRAFDLIVSGAINVQALLSGVMPLEDIETALQKTIKGEVVKLVIDPELTIQ